MIRDIADSDASAGTKSVDEDYWRYELWHLRQLRECCELGNNDTMEEYFVPQTDQRDDPPDADVAEPRWAKDRSSWTAGRSPTVRR